MTEAEWLACEGPLTLFMSEHVELSTRKQYLLAAAICWRIRGLLIDPNTLGAISILEAFADGAASAVDLGRATDSAVGNWDEFEFTNAFDEAQRAAVMAVVYALSRPDPVGGALGWGTQAVEHRGTQKTVFPAFANLIREVCGNLFRPVSVDPSWLTTDVLALARGIYDERAFDRMPILADALQDAGCASEDVLAHCRDPKQLHVRGCWVIDLLTGRG
jgi:hypothetical protein